MDRFGKVGDFELTNIHGKKLDSKWVGSQLPVEVTSSSVAGFRLDAVPCWNGTALRTSCTLA